MSSPKPRRSSRAEVRRRRLYVLCCAGFFVVYFAYALIQLHAHAEYSGSRESNSGCSSCHGAGSTVEQTTPPAWGGAYHDWSHGGGGDFGGVPSGFRM